MMESKSIRIPEDTYRSLKIMAAVEGIQLGQLVTSLLQEKQERAKMEQDRGIEENGRVLHLRRILDRG
jgi:hypothetical protein